MNTLDTTHLVGPVADRFAADDWTALTDQLNEHGHALTAPLLTPDECHGIRALYDETDRFRTTVDMARHRFGSGQYRYFTHELPYLVRQPAPWPEDLEEWLAMCHAAGQAKSAQILLRYGPGDWNALHRDVFGAMVFPLQVVIGLDTPGVDFTGGEFIMTEQRPRAQSRGSSTTLPQGHGLIFTTRDRPVASRRGWSTGPMRHGVSTVRSGRRHTLGLVFHDAT
jgi:hypothetical protein